MPPSTCPVEFALWWCQRYHRATCAVWSPDIEQVELFKTICKMRAKSWENRIEDFRASKWNVLGILSSTGQPDLRQALIHEILVCEPIVRLLACTANSIRASEIRQVIHPLFHDAFISTRHVRCKALEILICELDRGAEWARSLNRLRIVLEQWTDMLLGIASAQQNVPTASFSAYGFRNERIQEFAYETVESTRKLSPMLEDWFLLQGIRRTMRSFGSNLAVHPEWNSQVRQLAAGFLSPNSFLDECLTDSLQIDQRFAAIEHWFSMMD